MMRVAAATSRTPLTPSAAAFVHSSPRPSDRFEARPARNSSPLGVPSPLAAGLAPPAVNDTPVIASREVNTIAIIGAGPSSDRYLNRAAQLPEWMHGRIRVVDFTPEQQRAIRTGLAALRPLLRCGNQRLASFVRVDDVNKLPSLPIRAGAVSLPSGVIIFDQPITGPYFLRTVIHELAHQLLQTHDPFACADFSDDDGNPLVRRWKEIFEGNDLNGILEPRPSAYAERNALEDMAVSLETYMFERASLSKTRRAFFDDLFTQLSGTIPDQLTS